MAPNLGLRARAHYDWPMHAPSSLEILIDQLTSAPVSLTLYWGVLVVVASLEMLTPGRNDRLPLAPRFKVNFGLGLCTMALFSLPFMSEVALAELARDRGWGLLNYFHPGFVEHIGLSFLAYDLCGYTIHRVSHRIGWMWRLHRVHHSDSDLDLSTQFRSHPLDVVMILSIKYVLIVTLGLHPAALILHGLGKQLTMSFGHANIAPRPRISRVVSLLFVSPAFHAIHHSAHHPDTDTNYGEILTVWDRLLGSIGRVSGQVERFGLGDSYDQTSARLTAQLRLPFDPQ